MKNLFFTNLVFLVIFISFSQCRTISRPDEYYGIVMAGEPTQTSVVLVARLQKSDTLVNNDIQGIKGFIKFSVMRDAASASIMQSRFFAADSSNDFTAKFQFTGLRPGQKYLYCISYGADTSNCTSGPWNTFKTLNLPESEKHISFILSSGMNYNSLVFNDPSLKLAAPDVHKFYKEFPVINMISFLKPDFVITKEDFNISEITGSQDESVKINADWHRLLSIPEYNILTSGTPFFYLSTGNSPQSIAAMKHLPVTCDSDNREFFRTYRLNRDVQIWLLENLFAPEQAKMGTASQTELSWLKNTLKESDAPFKLLISPSGIIERDKFSGIVDSSESGNFDRQRDSLFIWLKNNGYKNNGLYFLACNAYYQYHSIDPSGFEEFSSGSLSSKNLKPEIPISDSLQAFSDAELHKPYVQKDTNGGFMIVTSNRDEYDSPVLLFRFFDENRKLRYAVNKF